MKKDTVHRRIVVLPAVILAMALLGACGNSGKKSTSPASAPSQASAALVGMNTCTTCHTVATADWLTSRHANLDPGGSLDSPGVPALAQIAGCAANCHDPGGDSAKLVASYTGNVPRPVVGCEACHGPGGLHANAGGAGPIGFSAVPEGVIGATRVSAQFKTCTSCHELLDSAGTGTATAAHDTAGSDPRVVSEGTNTNIITNTNANSITDTHFATPGAWRPASAGSLNVHVTTTDFIAVTGYAMNFADEKVCSNCHNPHKNAAINREWAQSAHADPQGIKIEPKSGAVVGDGFFSSAWAHYNWSTRPECQRCHTTTGFIAYAEALRAGNTDLAAAIRRGTVSPLASDPGFKPEMLECNGCHTDNRGTLRNAGAVTANYDFLSGGTTTFSLVSHTYPDVAGSNVCMLCHTAREIGDSIKGINDPALLAAGKVSPANFGNFGFVNSHYLSAGATVFTTSGYTFGNRNYQNINSYRHDQVGTPGAPGTGSNGPCIGCHMSRPNKNGNHIFLPVSRVRNGKTVTVTGITSEVCFTCHGPNDVLMLDLVREQREQFAEALEALKDQLEQRHYFFADASPYFYSLRDIAGVVSVTTGSAVVTNVTGSFWVASKVTGTSVDGIISDRFRVNDDGQYYAIKSVDSGTQLTLQALYTGPTNTGAAYTIIGDAVKNWLTSPDTDVTGNTTGKNNMGAAFNFNLFEHDPGAYAHNRYFVKRLIYDSIDWLDDNQLNFSVGTTLTAVCGVAQPPAFCKEATTYLLPNGVINGVAAERP